MECAAPTHPSRGTHGPNSRFFHSFDSTHKPDLRTLQARQTGQEIRRELAC